MEERTLSGTHMAKPPPKGHVSVFVLHFWKRPPEGRLRPHTKTTESSRRLTPETGASEDSSAAKEGSDKGAGSREELGLQTWTWAQILAAPLR